MIYREAGQFKVTYRSDQAIFPIAQDRWFVILAVLAAALVPPAVASEYWLQAILIPFLVYSLAAIGLNHNHIYGQARMLLDAGAELVSYYAPEPELAAEFGRTYPQATLARSAREILEDESVHLIASAAIAGDRAGIALETSSQQSGE